MIKSVPINVCAKPKTQECDQSQFGAVTRLTHIESEEMSGLGWLVQFKWQKEVLRTSWVGY